MLLNLLGNASLVPVTAKFAEPHHLICCSSRHDAPHLTASARCSCPEYYRLYDMVAGAGPVASYDYAVRIRRSLFVLCTVVPDPPTPVHDLGHGRLDALLPTPATSVWRLGPGTAALGILRWRVVSEQLKLLVVLAISQHQPCPVCLRGRLIMPDQLD